VGTLLDGTKFDSSRDRSEPFKFKLGAHQVIKGWDKVVETMKKGEICKVTLKPEYAYGENGSPPKIPANATLVFEIELLSWEEEKDLTKDKDGGIMKKVLHEGEKWETPKYESSCTVNLKVTNAAGDTVFEDAANKHIHIGSEEIPEGLEKALESMKKGEKAHVKVKSKYGYGANGNEALKIPPHTDLVYHIELVDFVKAKETWELKTFEEKYDFAVQRKNQGNAFFENSKLNLAAKKYEKSLDIFAHNSGSNDEEKKKIKELNLLLHLNLAMVHLKNRACKLSIEQCTKALDIDPNNVKGLYRRGMAHTMNCDYEEAKRDYEKALDIEPDSKTVKTALAQLKKKVQEEDRKDRKRFQNLFQRMAELDQEAKN
jgi:FK506-binding protein 4/5